MSKGLLLVISGFSGAGKGTVMKRLLELHDEYSLSISATTRKPREGEADGREYFFKTVEEFEKMIAEDALIEHAQYVGNYYRTQTGYYEHLELGNKFIVKDFDEILKILADIMILDDRELVTINQTKLPAHIVKERFRKLKSEHLEYLSDVIKENEYKIRNIRAFVLTAAYNAPSGIDAHYSALVSYDMRGGY